MTITSILKRTYKLPYNIDDLLTMNVVDASNLLELDLFNAHTKLPNIPALCKLINPDVLDSAFEAHQNIHELTVQQGYDEYKKLHASCMTECDLVANVFSSKVNNADMLFSYDDIFVSMDHIAFNVVNNSNAEVILSSFKKDNCSIKSKNAKHVNYTALDYVELTNNDAIVQRLKFTLAHLYDPLAQDTWVKTAINAWWWSMYNLYHQMMLYYPHYLIYCLHKASSRNVIEFSSYHNSHTAYYKHDLDSWELIEYISYKNQTVKNKLKIVNKDLFLGLVELSHALLRLPM